MYRSNPWLRVIFATLVVTAMLTVAGCSGSDGKVELGIDKAAKQIRQLISGGDSTDASSTPRTIVPSGTAGSAGTPGGSATGSKKPGSSAGTQKPGTAPGTPGGAAQAPEMRVKIIWWNDTVNKKPSGFEIQLGSTSIKPEISQKNGRATAAPARLDTPLELVVYPDGRSGKKVVVPVVLTAEMQPDSERDAIHVAVSDTEVRVLGSPVDNFDRTVTRF